MRNRSLLLSHPIAIGFIFLVPYFSFSQNVGIGTSTPAHKLDVNGVINSTTEYRIFGKPFFRFAAPEGGFYRNFSAGDSAGFSNTTGYANTFIGGAAGVRNTDGYRNCFVGSFAGSKNVIGGDNTFIGSAAGWNSTGNSNTFLGSGSGSSNTGGSNNTFLGRGAGSAMSGGSQNTFVGTSAGNSSVSGMDNVFVGQSAGGSNLDGYYNTLLGAYTDVGWAVDYSTAIGYQALVFQGINNATAIGTRAYVTQSNCIVLGSINGVNGATADTRVGIGTTSPDERLEIVGNLKLSGEVNHPATGTSHLLPVAYGSISSAGAINSSSDNFTVTRTAAGSYTIDIENHSYSLSTYSTVVTAVGSPLVATTNSGSGNLLIRIYNLSGVLADGIFHFVVYKQ